MLLCFVCFARTAHRNLCDTQQSEANVDTCFLTVSLRSTLQTEDPQARAGPLGSVTPSVHYRTFHAGFVVSFEASRILPRKTLW